MTRDPADRKPHPYRVPVIAVTLAIAITGLATLGASRSHHDGPNPRQAPDPSSYSDAELDRMYAGRDCASLKPELDLLTGAGNPTARSDGLTAPTLARLDGADRMIDAIHRRQAELGCG